MKAEWRCEEFPASVQTVIDMMIFIYLLVFFATKTLILSHISTTHPYLFFFKIETVFLNL